MNCQKFEVFVLDIARDQMIEAALREEMLAHVHECDHCEKRLAVERQLTLRLRRLASATRESVVSERVGAQLLEAFEQHAILRTRRQVIWRHRSWAAIAAVLLIVAGLVGIRWRVAPSVTRRPDSPATGKTKAAVENKVEKSPVNVSRSPANVVARSSSLHRGKVRARTKGESPSANHRAQEIATDFIPMNYGGVNLDEGGRVVRVELPRSAMVNFGLPVNMNRANERVKADVLFGVDGLAHAIRFVQ